ncbi:unnamed protein product [Cladocopium goreaui]|uniref:ABC1 atypical kinase-like domain-containing protein n=1 Tax=Cladocopium goreaui TaxID=2562237 RepID=A0A9P1CUN9_9DINO|nr:unnamed protein product [Cladocopium goreaui]
MLWLQHGLLPVLWNQVGRDTAVDVDKMFDASADSILATRTTPGIFMNWMQIVGGVRLRQRRLQKGECSLDPRLQERFSPSCYTEFLQVSPFGPGIGSYAEGFVPEDVMGAFDVRYSLGTPFREILENFQYMLKEHNWVGEASQSLQIQAAMVHGEATPPFFVMFEVRFDFKRSGYVAKELNIFLTATDMFPTTLEVVLHVLWALILFSLLFTQSFKVSGSLHSLWTALMLVVLVMSNRSFLEAMANGAVPGASSLPNGAVPGHAQHAPLATTTWQYEPEPPKRGLGFACCTVRQKPGSVEMPGPREDEQEKKVIWDTADLTWWDFQRRRWKTLWLMRTVYFRYKSVQESTEGWPEGPEREKVWVDCHTVSARELRIHAEEAKGLFIKAGQVMSAMVGTLPDAFTNEFLSLTDHLPVSRIEEVYRIIQRTFRQPPKVIFSEFDPEPLASASIAQVHRARLRSNGKVVAVKVQHDGVDRIFLEDIATLTTVAEQVAYWAPDLDFRKFAEEWRDSLPRELDFCHEMTALERAGNKLREAGNSCIVPRVHKDLCGTHVFVMEFIQGGPILDLGKAEFCERNGVDKHRVLTELLHAFGIMAFKDGMFHADPHAGNVRLVLDPNAPGGAKPVLLDWGLIREITDAERLGLAKVFHSLANFDIAGLFDVLESLGFSLRQELLNDDLKRDLIEKARGVVKDTINRHKTRENAREELAEFKARLNRAKEDAGMEGSMSPIYFLEDWPRCIIFFMRMLQILRGLCVACDAEGMPLLKIFSSHAREALQEGSRRQMLSSSLRIFGGRGDGIGHETPFTPKARVSRDSTLESQLQQKLQELQSRKQLVGAQVVVLRDNKVICSVAHGTLSTIDARPVQEQTRFPLLGATAGLAGLALLRTLRRKSGELIKAAEDANMKPENLLRKMLVSFPGHFGPFHLAGGVNRGNFGQSSGSRSAPCLAMGRTYRVTGGASNGLLVRQQRALSSTACAERLRHGSVVQELELTEGRLRYSLLFGVGPAEGWVSIHCKGQALLVETHLTDLAEAAAQAPWVNRVELMDVLMQVAESLDRGPRFRASKVLEGTNVPHVIEVEAMPGSMSLDEFWPSNCELSFAEMQDLYWRITCSSSCDSCTLALALTLKEMADHATLQHQGCRVVNLLVLNTLLDIRDLDELILVEKLSGARLPVLNTAASYDGNAAWRALGLDSPKVDLGAMGRAAFEAVPHWWLAALLESEDGRCMLHLDMCNYAYSSNRLESEPSSFHSFVTPDYELTPDAFPKLHRFRLGPKVNGLPPSCFSLKPLAELRHLRCSFGPVFATPLCTFAENKLGCNFGERFVVADDESLGALTVLHSDYCRAAQLIRQRIFGRLPAHTAAQILEIPGRPDLEGALVSLLEEETAHDQRPVLTLIGETLSIPLLSMKTWPLPGSHYLSLAETRHGSRFSIFSGVIC